MTAKQIPNSTYAPDGSLYITLTDGAGNLSQVSGSPGGSNTQVQYNNSSSFGGISGATTNGTTLTLTAPVLGAATATSINKVAITSPATSATLTIANGKTLTSNNTLTLAGTDSTTLTFQGTDTYVGRASTDTLTNKTFDTAGSGNSFAINGTAISAKTGTGSVVLATTPTLTTPVLGVATGTSLALSGSMSTSALGLNATYSIATNNIYTNVVNALSILLNGAGSFGTINSVSSNVFSLGTSANGTSTNNTALTWNSSKDVTLGGELLCPASTTAKANINLPATGVAPTSPVNGDIWFDGTNLKIQIGGATKVVTVS